MGRARHRISRGLIGVLAVTIVVGLVFYLHDTAKTHGAVKPANTAIADLAPTTPAPAKPQQTALLTSSAPTAEVSIGPAKTGENSPTNNSAAPNTTTTPPPSGAPSPSAKPAAQAAPAAKSTPVVLSATPLVDGKAKIDAGDLLGARRILNAVLLSGKLSDADVATDKTMLNDVNQTIVFSPKRFADDEFGGTYNVQPGELLTKIAAAHNITWQFLCRVNGLSDPRKLRAGATLKVAKGPFYAQVEKKKFNMEIWVGGEPYSDGACYITSFPVGLGRDDSTPTGKWMIQPGNKVKDPTYYSPRGEGIIEAGDPKNPLGHFWLGLVGMDGHAVGQQSYGIHGTIDPDSIGKQESMGCIRMRNEDVAQVFELLVEGKSMVIVKD